MEFCREEDELVVWKLDRVGRSLQELIELAGVLKDRGVEFVSLRESLDTNTPGGKLVFHVFGAVAEFERDLILERTMAGLEAAKARGRQAQGFGRGKGEAGEKAQGRGRALGGGDLLNARGGPLDAVQVPERA